VYLRWYSGSAWLTLVGQEVGGDGKDALRVEDVPAPATKGHEVVEAGMIPNEKIIAEMGKVMGSG